VEDYSHHWPFTGIYPVTESLVLPPDVRDYIMSAFYGPTCPKCKTMTLLARITPGTSGLTSEHSSAPLVKRFISEWSSLSIR
jgi:hypothetical protein